MSKHTEEIHTSLCARFLHSRTAPHILERVTKHGNFRALLDDSTFGPLLKRERDNATRVLEECQERALEIVPFSSPLYPQSLRATPAPPILLFVRGAVNALCARQSIALVGARSASIDSCAAAATFAREFAEQGICVVSGLALGIDGAAHRGALECSEDGSTIAVLAHGLDSIYPPSHEALAERIVDRGGALISEYPVGTSPFKHHFLERNRIVAGLAKAVVVIQAGTRSGSLVTARYAAEVGRDVFVVDAEHGYDLRFEGSKRLISDGAKSVSSAREVLDEFQSEATPYDDQITLPVTELLSGDVVSGALVDQLETEGKLQKLPDGLVTLNRLTLSNLISSARARLADIDLK